MDEDIEDNVYESYTGEVEESTIALAKKQKCSYGEAFAYLFEDSQFTIKELKPYDLRMSSVRQLELPRGYIAAINLSDDSVDILEKLATDAGIKDPYRDLDKDRNKLKMNGVHDIAIAFGGSLLRYLQRIELDVSKDEFISLQRDAFKTLLLALVDFKVSNGRGHNRLLQCYRSMIGVACELEGPITNTRSMQGAKMVTTRVGVNPDYVWDLYRCRIAPTVNQIKLSQIQLGEAGVTSELPAMLQGDCCGPYQIGIAGGSPLCQVEDKIHIDNFHKCVLCRRRHPLYNCPFLRCIMKLTHYQSTLQTQVFTDKKLPPRKKGPNPPFRPRNGNGNGNNNRNGNGNGGKNNGKPNKPNKPNQQNNNKNQNKNNNGNGSN